MLRDRDAEAIGFQESAPYDASIDMRCDFVMVYGVDDTLPERIERWRQAGYRVHLMTGISWGAYQDYLYGWWDGRQHWDEAQTAAGGQPILHGGSRDVPYMVPTLSFTSYLIEKLRPAIGMGVDAIHLEEPEFWSRAGYSEAFKREWLAYYGEPWQPPHGSPDAHYRSGRLKRYLLTRSVHHVFSSLRDEAIRQGRDVKLYVPTHSLLNYTQWQIVSPESALRTIPAWDGCIAQVWTGTSRTPNVYAGVVGERTFETAYLEYGISAELTRGTDRRLWFLHDPIEDHAGRTWEDYRANYQRTLVASLLHPGVARYEIAPWPNRIFNRPYLRAASGQREPIPRGYGTELLVAVHSLRDMDQPDVAWEHHGPRIGLLLSDTAMFQRWQPEGTTAGHFDGLQNALELTGREQLHFSSFYGLAMPLLKDGQPVTPVQLEHVADTPGYLDDFDLLVLSYEFMKPLSAAVHYALAGWVARGGGLLYVGDGSDPYHAVREWWSERYPSCAHHLFEALGTDLDHARLQRVARGAVRVVRAHPGSLTRSVTTAAHLCLAARELAAALGHRWVSINRLVVRRGPYLIGAVVTESGIGAWPIEGRYIDLLNAELPLVRGRHVQPGEVVWLRDLDNEAEAPALLASASRIRDWTAGAAGLSFVSEAPSGIEVRTVLRVATPPRQVLLDGKPTADCRYDAQEGLLWLWHPGRPAGTSVWVE